jgi:SAM-dependent methyltransferase
VSIVRRLHRQVVWGRRVDVLARCIAELLPARGRVLDVGCGDGAVAAAVLGRRPAIEIMGVDVSVRPDTHIPVHAFDGRRLPFDDGSFDAVTFVDVLHHTDNQRQLLAEAARVAPTVILKDHLADGLLARPTLRLMDWGGNTKLGVALPYNYWTAGEWADAFGSTGLVVEAETTRLGLYPAPLSWAFDRRLHAVWQLRRRGRGHAG